MIAARPLYIGITFIAAVLAGWIGGPPLAMSSSAVSAIIDVFAILAAVLVAVISIIGDPSMLIPGSWRIGYVHAEQIQLRIARFSYLFLLYILTLLNCVIAMMAKDSEWNMSYEVFFSLSFLSSWSFLLSIPLPFSLMGIQRDRMKEVIKSRKELLQ